MSAKVKDSFAHKGYFARSSILLAGVVMNFIFAWVIFFMLFWSGTNPGGVAPIAINTKFPTETKSLLVPTYEQAKDIGLIKTDGVLLEPIAGYPADLAGIKKGDIVTEANGSPVRYSTDILKVLEANPANVSFKIKRGSETKIIDILPKDQKIGSYIIDNIIDINDSFVYSYNLLGASRA